MSSGAGAAGAAGAGAGVAGGGVAGDAGQQGVAEAQGNGQQQVAGGLDPAAISELLGALTASQEQMRNELPGAQLPEGEFDGGEGLEGDDGDGLDLDALLGYGQGEGGEIPFGAGLGDAENAEIAEGLAGAVDRFMAPMAEALAEQQQQLGEQREALATERRAREYDRLAADLPALGDGNVMREVTDAARAVGEVVGLSAEQALSPHMLRMTFLALRALEYEQAGEQRGADADAAAHLEGGAGAVPTGGQVDDRGARIVNANRTGGRRGAGALPFGT